MSHEVETMAYAGEVPWHGLGVPVSNDLTPAQMLEKAGLDWSVNKADTFFKVDGRYVKTGKQVLVRSSDNRVLTHVSEEWEPVQNAEAFDFFNDFVGAGHMEMHTAGSLKDGNMVWALAKVNDSFDAISYKGEQDRVESYLLFSNPHQYGKCIDIRFTAIRVVCNNTITLALAGKNDLVVRLNHRRKFDAEMVKKTLGIAEDRLDEYRQASQFLTKKRFTVDSLLDYYREVLPSASKKDADKLSLPARKAQEALEIQPGAEFGRGSWWQAFNSVTFTLDHLVGRGADTRLSSAWYGPNRQKKIAALNKAIEYAEAA